MNAVTYGNLLDSADRHLIAAGRSRTDVNDRADALHGLYHLTVVMARHLDAVAGVGAITHAAGSPWQRAAEVGEALHLAADGIAEAVLQTEGASSPDGKPGKQATGRQAIKHLADAAAAMSAAHDLLRTNQATDPEGVIVDRSDWAAIIRSEPVTLAMVQEMTERSGRVASWLARLMAGAAPLPQAAQAGLLSTNDWFRIASQIAASGSDPAADLTTGRELLRGIPIATAPERIAPRVGESTTDLNAGIAATAHRLRTVAVTMGEAAHTSPYFSGPAWRWTALSAAIVSDTCTATLHTLADRAADLAAPSVPPGKLREAAKCRHRVKNDPWATCEN
jgi:hypothetical protein